MSFILTHSYGKLLGQALAGNLWQNGQLYARISIQENTALRPQYLYLHCNAYTQRRLQSEGWDSRMLYAQAFFSQSAAQ
jgi:hypothetical protein